MHIVTRTSNRYFIGLPLCESGSVLILYSTLSFSFRIPGRDPGYISLQERFTLDVIIGAQIINCFQNFLKPYVPLPLERDYERYSPNI